MRGAKDTVGNLHRELLNTVHLQSQKRTPALLAVKLGAGKLPAHLLSGGVTVPLTHSCSAIVGGATSQSTPAYREIVVAASAPLTWEHSSFNYNCGRGSGLKLLTIIQYWGRLRCWHPVLWTQSWTTAFSSAIHSAWCTVIPKPSELPFNRHKAIGPPRPSQLTFNFWRVKCPRRPSHSDRGADPTKDIELNWGWGYSAPIPSFLLIGWRSAQLPAKALRQSPLIMGVETPCADHPLDLF